MTTIKAAIAATRFGLGAQTGELRKISTSPEAWLLAQVKNPQRINGHLAALPSTTDIAASLIPARQGRPGQRLELNADAKQEIQEKARKLYLGEVNARLTTAIETPTPFYERLVFFWSDHFTVSTTKALLSGFVGAFEREAIRPHVTGSFEDLLLSAAAHPAMILYLDNHVSIGPNSPAGRRADRGLNENLAREILELHTLGVNDGYSQEDVTNFAKILTGWTFGGPDNRFGSQRGEFQFVELMHEPGSIRVLGKTYREDGIRQPRKVLSDLARHPSTARHIAEKLTRYFISDSLPEAVVKKLEAAFLTSGGNLSKVYEALIAAPEAWQPKQQKFKQPYDYIISTLRAVPGAKVEDDKIIGVLSLMGQRPYSAGSPAGWPDENAFWTSPDGIMRRAEWANALASRTGRTLSYDQVIDEALGPLASQKLKTAAARAADRREALALVFASPEFLRR